MADFQRPIDEHVFQHEEALAQCVDFVLTDPVYNIRQVMENNNSSQDISYANINGREGVSEACIIMYLAVL